MPAGTGPRHPGWRRNTRNSRYPQCVSQGSGEAGVIGRVLGGRYRLVTHIGAGPVHQRLPGLRPVAVAPSGSQAPLRGRPTRRVDQRRDFPRPLPGGCRRGLGGEPPPSGGGAQLGRLRLRPLRGERLRGERELAGDARFRVPAVAVAGSDGRPRGGPRAGAHTQPRAHPPRYPAFKHLVRQPRSDPLGRSGHIVGF